MSFILNRYFLALIVCSLFSLFVQGQDTTSPRRSIDTLTQVTDTTMKANDTTATIPSHSPLKATLMSAILPGAGQVYNKKYWKVPVIYAGFAGGGYFIRFFHNKKQTIEDAIEANKNGNIPGDPRYQGYTIQQLQKLEKRSTKRYHFSIILTSLWYVINIVDANVDAHLYNFNVNDDLSLKVSPHLYNSPYYTSTGLSISLHPRQ